jgi:3-oxoacyl-[acyl-carrier-protein] synthase II
MRPRVGVFGWGVVAPKSPNIKAFEKNLACAATWLSPFNGFGPDNFLVGMPEFCFEDYREWIDHRFAPRHFQNLKEKMDLPTQFAIGAFLQSLDQNPGIEAELSDLGSKAHVYVGTGLGSLTTIQDVSVAHYKAQRRWDRFWSQPERNSAMSPADVRTDFASDDEEEAWRREWMARSPELHEYLAALAQIDGLRLEGEIEAGKLNAIREKEKRRTKLREKWQAPEPPWSVSANLIWNIHNVPASQISILAKISGMAFAPVAACSTFGVALKLAISAIQAGDAKIVVVGATDPPPHPLTVGAFYSARVISANKTLSVPLTRLQGTHVAGGSVVWIVGDFDYMTQKGFKPLGMEPVAVGVSSDAHHIITPSAGGPKLAIQDALSEAHASPDQLGTWDLHATATPGDFSEMSTFHSIFPESVLVTARKGTFGHGMSAGGGWELTAQYLSYQHGTLFPTPLSAAEFNPSISSVHNRVVFDVPCEFPDRLGGKLSMGIGGINACVISRPLK